MKKLLLVFILCYYPLFSENIVVEKVDMKSLGSVKIGEGNFELGYVQVPSGIEPFGPSDIAIEGSDIYLYDYWNSNRLIKTNTEFTDFKVITKDNTNNQAWNFLYLYKNNLISINRKASIIKIFNIETKEEIYQYLNDNNRSYFVDLGLYSFGFFQYEDYLIGETDNESFILIDIENNNISNIDSTEVINIINAKDSFNIKNNYIFIIGNFTTVSAAKFYNYFYNYSSDFQDISDQLENTNFKHKAYFTGRDRDGNFYWSNGSGIYIFSKIGRLIKRMKVDRKTITKKSPMLKFSIDDEGNLYRLVVKDDKYHLMMIERTW